MGTLLYLILLSDFTRHHQKILDKRLLMTVQKPVPLSLHWNADDDVENIRRYTYGGYHPIRLGEVLSTPADTEPSNSRKYRILSKLGHGSFSTVWLASAQHHPASG